MDNLERQLEKAFNKVTAKTCQKIRKTEDEFWEEDAKIDQISLNDL